jgi:Transposase domain (DUF772)
VSDAGLDDRTSALSSYVDLERRVRSDRPLRAIRTIVNEALCALEGEFTVLCARVGRPLIEPERLLRAMLPQAFYFIRSERQLIDACRDPGWGDKNPGWVSGSTSSEAASRTQSPKASVRTSCP